MKYRRVEKLSKEGYRSMKNAGVLAAIIIALVGFTSVLVPRGAAAQDAAKVGSGTTVKQPCETAESNACFPRLPGTWREIDTPAARLPADQKLFLSKIQGVASMLRRLKVFNPPIGFKAEAYVDFTGLGCDVQKDCTAAPLFGRIWIQFLCFVAQGRPEPSIDHEIMKDVQFMFNDPGSLWNGGPQLNLSDGRGVAYTPKEWGHVGGVTLYLNQRDRDELYIFLTKGSRPLWIPVTREQYLSAAIRKLEADAARGGPDERLAELAAEEKRVMENIGSSEDGRETLQSIKQERAGLMQEKARLEQDRKEHGDPVIDPLRSQLQTLSAGERASQAWIDRPFEPLVPAGTGRSVVVFNPDYFDRSRPRSDVQLIVVGLNFGGQKLDDIPPPFQYATDVSRARLWEFVREVDWQQVAAVMK